MAPTILRFRADVPDLAELRQYLGNASKLLVLAGGPATADGQTRIHAMVLQRARLWVQATLCGIDQQLRALDPPVAEAITDSTTDKHVALDDLLIPTLVALRGRK